MTFTPLQSKMLHNASESPDGTVLAGGFNRRPHTSATAKSLHRRGLVELVKQGHGYEVWRITDAGRAALSARCDVVERSTSGGRPCSRVCTQLGPHVKHVFSSWSLL